MRFAPSRLSATLSALPITLGQSSSSSSSRGSSEQLALARPKLWDKLVLLQQRSKQSWSKPNSSHSVERGDQGGGLDLGSSLSLKDAEIDRIAVSISWPLDRRWRKSKRENFVIWVKKDQSPSQSDKERSGAFHLFVPASLLPAYISTPTQVLLSVHKPIPLDFLVIQPVNESNPPLEEEVDLSPLYHYQHRFGPIIRQGSTLPSPSPPYRVLMTEPVIQGVLTSATRIIITPFQALEVDANVIVDSASEGDSSYPRTHISLTDFDPDSFLSSSLARPLSGSPTANGGINHLQLIDDSDVASSLSSTSGSITPRPNGLHRSTSPAIGPEDILNPDDEHDDGGARFGAVRAWGKAVVDHWEEEVCWVGVGGLGRAGIFEGDWVILKAGDNPKCVRLAQVQVWEQLDEPDDDLPANPIVLPPSLYRALLSSSSSTEISVQPTPFGPRRPTLPVAKTMKLARIATPESMEKTSEGKWIEGLRQYFSARKNDAEGEDTGRLIRRGDILSIAIARRSPRGDNDETELNSRYTPASTDMVLVYFIVTSLSFEPLVPPEEDFRTSTSSKARAGELGCWVDVGKDGQTNIVLTGVERARILAKSGDGAWHGADVPPPPFSLAAANKMRDLTRSCFSQPSIEGTVQLSLLVKGFRGSGKLSLVRSIADELGLNVMVTECYDFNGETSTATETTLQMRMEKAKICAPCIFLLNHIEALASKSDSQATGRQPGIVKVIEELSRRAKEATIDTGFPVIVLATTADEEAVPGPLLGCFKQEITIPAPSESERLMILNHALSNSTLSPDINLRTVAAQTAALQAGDLINLASKATDNAISRASKMSDNSPFRANQAGIAISAADLMAALEKARESYADSIGAPKIPNVSWDDVGGLGAVKKDILDTIQLPLEHPELFASGLKKRSGILLYGPPGTGKTLLAKAVATSCSLNFLSVKGPELLNMYIGESEANVRRVFQRAREAAPCVIFMDELDSIAPKRGIHGDSGGVMDRIVSQLLAELDGMSGSQSDGGSSDSAAGNGHGGGAGGTATNGNVFVMGATNRPDLLDPALLRPGRFDRMLYLDVPTTHQAQYDILLALTRKFSLSPDLSLMDVAQSCPLHLTGADLYALCSDAMLRAMSRLALEVDDRIKEIEATPGPHDWPKPLTPAYYLAAISAISNSNPGHSGEHISKTKSISAVKDYDVIEDVLNGGEQEFNGSTRQSLIDSPRLDLGTRGISSSPDTVMIAEEKPVKKTRNVLSATNANVNVNVHKHMSALILRDLEITKETGREIKIDRVEVGPNDFKDALKVLKPSVSPGEMDHYRKVQEEFKGFSILGGGSGGHHEH